MTSLKQTLDPVLFRIHPAGWPFIVSFVAVTLLVGVFWPPFFAPGVVLSIWCVFFFRDPDRVTPTGPGLVVSPADGKVQMIAEASPPEELGLGAAPLTRISIFMNVFNCHVNRSPVDGRIARIAYRPGRFVNASLDKASEHNERQSLRVAMADGREVVCVQIAGLIARRIVCEVTADQMVQAGARIGMIRFGSRVDVYLPEGVAPLVVPGQLVIAGETVIADVTSQGPAREGEIR